MRTLLIYLLIVISHPILAEDIILAKQHSIHAKSLDDTRQLYISLPEHYDPNKSWPVLYVLHGQWDMLPTLATLDLMMNRLPSFIVVGVESSGMELMPDNGKTTPFSTYLLTDVVPYINQHFSTAKFQILSGHSNSGRFVLDLWLRDSPSFSQFYAFSPSLDDGYLTLRMASLSDEFLAKQSPLVITMANEGDHMLNPFNEIKAKLTPALTSNFAAKHFPNTTHRETKHPSLTFALATTFKGWEPDYETKTGGFDKLQSHYTALTRKFGFDISVPTETLQRLAAWYATKDSATQKANLSAIVKYSLEKEGPNPLLEITDYLKNNDYKPASALLLDTICSYASKLKECR